jgi:molybdopterin molybdotransferase
MDGYAVRSMDTQKVPCSLSVVGEIAAGKVQDFVVGKQEAASIMTGAVLPEGADAVVMVEKTELLPNSEVILHASVQSGENVAAQGSEVMKGEVVIQRGQLLGPAWIGVLAVFGRTAVEVQVAPTIGILPTGSEVVGVEDVPAAGQIRNSNAPMLAAQCRRLGLLSKELPVVGDDPKAIQLAIGAGLEQADILLLTGGVSMGKHDYVPQVLKEEGVETIFHKVAVKPGKPLLFGRRREKLVFGLPGNPVSSFVTFELFVRPTVCHWLGLEQVSLPKVGALTEAPFQNLSERDFYAPGEASSTESGLVVRPVQTRGSADLVAFSRANCLVILPAECGSIPPGAHVTALLLSDLIERGVSR